MTSGPRYYPLGAPPRSGDVVFVVVAGYHLLDALRTTETLRVKGVPAAIVLRGPPPSPTLKLRPSYRRFREAVAASAAAGLSMTGEVSVADVVTAARCLVLRNDWGPEASMAVLARDAGVRTVGWVEGVQDFDDVDTGRQRQPYTTVETVFSLGDFDAKKIRALGAERVFPVGSERMWDLWRTPPMDRDPRAVINVNFTYGVFTAERRNWTRAAIAACEEAGTTPVLSRHPADRGFAGRRFESDVPILDLLQRSSHLVSRFSTVMYDAMLLGVPVCYFNPHGEAVDTFQTSNGAVRRSASTAELIDDLRAPVPEPAVARATAEEFLTDHIVLTGVRPAERAAAHIAELVGE